MNQAEQKQTVLVLDDDAAMLRGVRNLLRSAGYEAIAYQSPAEFLDGADFECASCVVVDVSMPVMEGFEIHDELSRRGVRVPVIVMSGVPSDEAEARATAAGILSYFSKPFDEEEFLAAVERASGARGSATKAD